MLKSFTRSVALAGALAASGLAAHAAVRTTPLAIESIAKNPAISSLSMTVEGDYMVGLVSDPSIAGGDMSLAVWDLKNPSAPPVVTPSNDRMKFVAADALKQGQIFAVARQEWTGTLNGCGEGRLTGATATFVTKFYMTDVKMQKFEEPFQQKGRRAGNELMEQCFNILNTAGIASFLPLDPENVVVSRLNMEANATDFVKVNLRTNAEEFLFRQTGRESVGLIDPRTGEVLTKGSVEPIGDDYEIRTHFKNAAGEWEIHDALTSLATNRFNVDVVGRDEQTGKFYVITDKFSDKAALYFYDAAKKAFDNEPLFAHPQFDVSGISLGTKPGNFNQLLSVRYAGAANESFIVDPQMKAVADALGKQFPGQQINLLDYTDDMSKVLFSAQSSAHPPSFHMLVDKTVLTKIGDSRPDIDPKTMKQAELIYWKPRDYAETKMEIPGLLFLPKGWTKADGPLPTVIIPHGGPWSRDFANWDSSGWPQFLATRGYAVMQPQYRGSTGWGRQLWLAGDKEWGQKMQDDKDDGAAWLVQQGIADPNRIAMFGYSYGGFAAMAATVRPNSPYQCAIAGAGVSNLTRIGNNWSENRLQRIIQGRTVTGMDPMRETANANIPILVYHGDRDVRVPLFHGRDFYNAVKDKVDAELLVVEDMPHSLPWYPDHHRVTLAAIERFLASDKCGMKPNA